MTENNTAQTPRKLDGGGVGAAKGNGNQPHSAWRAVDDCLSRVPTRFELVLLTAQHARACNVRHSDALREIAAGGVDLDVLKAARLARAPVEWP
jgi:DNA-directed RNA polymerase subunit K/omega